MKRRAFMAHALGLAAGVGGCAVAAGARRSWASTGAAARVLDLDLFDARRGRPVPVRLYLPPLAFGSGPVPLVVFSHGLGGARTGYRYLGAHWAQEGMASLHPQHVGSDSRLWQGNPLALVSRLQAAASEAEAQARVLDMRFALDHVLASDQAPLIDPNRIAAAGHSYGANTTLLACGAQVVTADGAPADLRDPRLRAAVLISAPPWVNQGPLDQVLGAVDVPTLHVTSIDDTINLPGYRSTYEDRVAIFEAMTRSARALAVFNAGGHSIFTDRITRSGPQLSARIKAATRELSTIFLQQSLSAAHLPAMEDGRCASRAASPPPRLPAEGWTPWRLRHQDLLATFIAPGPQAQACPS